MFKMCLSEYVACGPRRVVPAQCACCVLENVDVVHCTIAYRHLSSICLPFPVSLLVSNKARDMLFQATSPPLSSLNRPFFSFALISVFDLAGAVS